MISENKMTDNDNKFTVSGEATWQFANAEETTLKFADVAEVPFKFVLNGYGHEPAGSFTINKGVVSFEGNAEASVKVFIDELVKQWSPQWKQAQKRIKELEAMLPECANPPENPDS